MQLPRDLFSSEPPSPLLPHPPFLIRRFRSGSASALPRRCLRASAFVPHRLGPTRLGQTDPLDLCVGRMTRVLALAVLLAASISFSTFFAACVFFSLRAGLLLLDGSTDGRQHPSQRAQARQKPLRRRQRAHVGLPPTSAARHSLASLRTPRPVGLGVSAARLGLAVEGPGNENDARRSRHGVTKGVWQLGARSEID